jgi:hypothetical protein
VGGREFMFLQDEPCLTSFAGLLFWFGLEPPGRDHHRRC